MQLYLIRHPRPLIADGFCYGQLDVDCENPEPVAESLRLRLPAGAPVFASPLLRARRLAAALRPDYTTDARLCELSFGQWEGQLWDSIDRPFLDEWADDVLHFTPPGGESVAALRDRAVEFIHTLQVPQAVLVTHAGIIRALIGHWHAQPTEEWTQHPIGFGSLTILAAERTP